MKNLGRVGTFLLLATGVMGLNAQAQELARQPCAPNVNCGDVGTEAAAYNITGNSVSLEERIVVSIPARVGMHLHKTLWEVDLADLSADNDNNCKCYRAGEHDKGSGLDVLYGGSLSGLRDLLKKATWTGDAPKGTGVYQQDSKLDLKDARFARVSKYPGYEIVNNKVIWKGPIMCIGQKVVEKFSNYPTGWNFSASTVNTTKGFPNLLVLDRFQAHTTGGDGLGLVDGFNVKGDYLIKGGKNQGSVEMASSDKVNVTTGGWLDDHMLEVLVFDGSEVAGNYSTTVIFTLTGTL